jgi:membrane associated rhomboid family serine protease
MVANAVVFLLQITVFTAPGVIEVGKFSPMDVGVRWWTFVTYMFVHVGFLHLAFNMLMLFFFGPAVEERMGGTSFALYYLTCGVGGAILSLAMSLAWTVGPFVGASGAVMGVMLAFALYWPDTPVRVFPLPVPVKVKWLVAFLIIMDLLAARAGANDGVAHFAHLGGLLFGLIYLRSEENVLRRARRIVTRQQKEASRNRPPWHGEPVHAVEPRTPSRTSEPKSPPDEVDRVLDKILESGIESLTPEERRVLDEASRQLRKH